MMKSPFEREIQRILNESNARNNQHHQKEYSNYDKMHYQGRGGSSNVGEGLHNSHSDSHYHHHSHQQHNHHQQHQQSLPPQQKLPKSLNYLQNSSNRNNKLIEMQQLNDTNGANLPQCGGAAVGAAQSCSSTTTPDDNCFYDNKKKYELENLKPKNNVTYAKHPVGLEAIKEITKNKNSNTKPSSSGGST